MSLMPLSFLHPVVCDRLRGCMRTGMAMTFMRMFMNHETEQSRSPTRDLCQYRRLTRRRGRSGSRVGTRDYDYEPGGSGQVFGVRLVKRLPRSRAAGPVEGKWQRRQNQQWMERRRKDEGRERDGESRSRRTWTADGADRSGRRACLTATRWRR